MLAENSDAPLSPELVLVAPPEEARRAREALSEPRPPGPAPVAAVASGVEGAAVPEVPAVPPRRRRSRLLVAGLVLALGLGVGGFLVARELGDRSAPRHTAVAPAPQTGAATTAAATTSPTTATTTGTTTAATATTATARSSTTSAAPPPRPAPSAPVVSWKARPGIRHYRLDLLRGGAVILTILTDAPRTRIPSSWPNAGRVRRLSRGTYEWTVRAATPGPSRRLAHGTFSVR